MSGLPQRRMRRPATGKTESSNNYPLRAMTLPFLELDGSAFEQGRQHGRALSTQIAHNLEIYYDRFLREGQLQPAEARRRANSFIPVLDGLPYFETLRGLAAGSGYDLIDLLVLNMRYELLYYQYGVCGIGQPDGCTAFTVLPAASTSGHLLLGQNWDWIPDVKGAVLHTREGDGLETLAFTEAGIVGAKIGLNSAGLGLTINGLLSTSDDWSRPVLPFHGRCYDILRQHTLEQGVAVVKRGARGCSANFLIAQPPDKAWDLEAAPDAVNVLHPEHSLLVHANHFVRPQDLGIEEPVTERRPHTYWRQTRLRELMEATSSLTVGDLERTLRDHAHHPDGICRHENRVDPPDEWCITVTSAIMDLDERRLQLTDGPPCEHPYEHFSLSETAPVGFSADDR